MKFIKRLFVFSLICTILGVSTIVGFYFYVKPELPDVATLKDVKLQTPMQVFTQDGKLISQFGEKRRIPLRLEDISQHLIDAVIATEDSRFYHHFGIDPIGIARAASVVLISGSAKQGASTITQQLARNFFLSNEKKLMRKIKEAFIAIHIEQLLTKEEILELYLNKIFLGHRSYGVGAAAQVYFGKEAKDLTISEAAVIAGLPKAPSSMNPIYSIDRAKARRDIVLSRMLAENYISQQEYEVAKNEELTGKHYGAQIELSAPYIAEMARAWMIKHYGEEAYTSGMKVYTSINSKLQDAAQKAAINNLFAYDERHGYRGAEQIVWKEDEKPLNTEEIEKHLKKQPNYDELYPAVVLSVADKSAKVYVKNRGEITLDWDHIKWARKFITDERQGYAPKKATDVLKSGEQIWVRQIAIEQATDESSKAKDPKTESDTEKAQVVKVWQLSQVPNANTAFVAISPENGAVLALVGGFNFVHSKFNRATQSIRQVGSGIKPFIYSAAIDKGLTLATLINDAPINQWDASSGVAWRPKNSPPKYMGPLRMRIGLAQSKNVMAVRVMRQVGLNETREFLTRFGFDKEKLPQSETIALGAGSLTPLQMAQGYSVFANGGYYVEPYYIDHIESPYGDIEYQSTPKKICHTDCDKQQYVVATPESTDLEAQLEGSQTTDEELSKLLTGEQYDETDILQTGNADSSDQQQYAPHVITEQNAFLVREMLYANIWGGGNWRIGTGWNGTGWRAQKLKRRDIGGKTGTTNDAKDTWYNGFAPGLVATAWVGFDSHNRKLGKTSVNRNFSTDKQVYGGEAGAKTAQPAWIDFMKVALEDIPPQSKTVPPHIVRIRIDSESGLLTRKSGDTTMFEYFAAGTQPREYIEDQESEIDDPFLFQSENGGSEQSLF